MLRPKKLPLPFFGDLADHVAKGVVQGQPVLGAAPNHGFTECVREEWRLQESDLGCASRQITAPGPTCHSKACCDFLNGRNLPPVVD